MYQTYRRRRRRRFNPGKFLTFLVALTLVCLAGFYFATGRLPFIKDGNPIASGDPSSPGPSGGNTPGDASPTPTPEPTPWPTPEAMPPESTDLALIDVSWQDPAIFTGAMAYDDKASSFLNKWGTTLYHWIFENNKPVENYTPKDLISFGSPESYTQVKGVTAFRGNHYRDGGSYGTPSVKEKKLEIVWEYGVGAISAENSYWPGTGWTGQPLLVNWPSDVRNLMNIKDELKSKDLVEVIYPTLDGNIYFLDLETGLPTRDKLHVGFPMKGTGLIDPRGYPILYTGMGLNENSGVHTEFKYMMFNLLDQTPLYNILGRDDVAFRKWGAFDSSAIVDGATDTFIEPGENGLVYKVKLNTNFDKEAGTLAISPQLTKYRYKDSVNVELGIENSAAYYKNYMYFCDNGGIFQCIDLNTMEPVWTYDVGDDTDSTTVIEETSEGVFLYTGNQVDKRSEVTKATENANIRKFNALTGELIWQKNVPCLYNFYINGGVLGSPMLGKDDIDDIIIYPVCFTGSTTDGKMLALNKKTGEEVWVRNLNAYSWSSPVAIKSSEGKTYGIFCDFNGSMHLFDPKTGKDIDVISLERNIESTPAVYNDMIVVGSYAQKIFGVKIK